MYCNVLHLTAVVPEFFTFLCLFKTPILFCNIVYANPFAVNIRTLYRILCMHTGCFHTASFVENNPVGNVNLFKRSAAKCHYERYLQKKISPVLSGSSCRPVCHYRTQKWWERQEETWVLMLLWWRVFLDMFTDLAAQTETSHPHWSTPSSFLLSHHLQNSAHTHCRSLASISDLAMHLHKAVDFLCMRTNAASFWHMGNVDQWGLCLSAKSCSMHGPLVMHCPMG